MNKDIRSVVDYYPDSARKRFATVRDMILRVAREKELGQVEESLKWGEPSFAVKKGSPIRVAWTDKAPERLGIYFICTTKLVDTFRELYGESLDLQDNRALLLNLDSTIPEDELRHCLELALQYHSLKQLPLLGA